MSSAFVAGRRSTLSRAAARWERPHVGLGPRSQALPRTLTECCGVQLCESDDYPDRSASSFQMCSVRAASRQATLLIGLDSTSCSAWTTFSPRRAFSRSPHRARGDRRRTRPRSGRSRQAPTHRRYEGLGQCKCPCIGLCAVHTSTRVMGSTTLCARGLVEPDFRRVASDPARGDSTRRLPKRCRRPYVRAREPAEIQDLSEEEPLGDSVTHDPTVPAHVVGTDGGSRPTSRPKGQHVCHQNPLGHQQSGLHARRH